MEIIKGRRLDNYSKTPTGNKNVINALFATIKINYPLFMRDQNESDMKRMWFAHLSEFADNRIEDAAFEMVDKFPKYPPTLGEFKGLVREMNKVKPGLAIGIDDICSNCRSHRSSENHKRSCKS